MLFLSIDPALRKDRCAVVGVEFTPTKNQQDTPDLKIILAELLPRNLTSPEVVSRLADIIELTEPRLIVIDSGGLGDPITQQLRYELKTVRGHKNKYRIVGVKTLGSGQGQGKFEYLNWTVPKDQLLSRVLIAIEQGKLSFEPTARQSEALLKELSGFRVAVRNDKLVFGNDVATGHTTAAHDDLAVATALVVFAACRGAIKKGQLSTPLNVRVITDPLTPTNPEFKDGRAADAMIAARQREMGWGGTRRSGLAGIYSIDLT